MGCGQGYGFEHMQWPDYTGIDLHAAEIEKAKELFPRGKFLVGDLFNLESSWDVVMCSRVLIHIPNLDKAMERLLKAARKHLCIYALAGDSGTTRYDYEDGSFSYMRSYTKEIWQSFGKCSIQDLSKYSLIHYQL